MENSEISKVITHSNIILFPNLFLFSYSYNHTLYSFHSYRPFLRLFAFVYLSWSHETLDLHCVAENDLEVLTLQPAAPECWNSRCVPLYLVYEVLGIKSMELIPIPA